MNTSIFIVVDASSLLLDLWVINFTFEKMATYIFMQKC